MLRISTVLTLSLLVGCVETEEPNDKTDVDTDEDGLMDDEEDALGTDPELADSDGDTLNDGAEVDLGTDPVIADTDLDSYQDGWEVTEGTDPLDANSVIYKLGWPYNPNKAQYEGRDWDGAGYSVGDLLANVSFMDPSGDLVDIYDFADQGKPIMIDIAAMWCGPCQGIAKWLAGITDPSSVNGISAPHVVEAVENGEVYWVTILGDDLGGTYQVDQDELNQWADAFPDEHVPVLAGDSDMNAVSTLLAGAWPTTILYDEHLEVTTGPGPGNDFYAPISALEDMLASGTLE